MRSRPDQNDVAAYLHTEALGTDRDQERASAAQPVLYIVAAFALLLLTAYAAYLLINREIQRQTLPSKLQLGWFYAEGSCGAFPGFQRSYAFGLAQTTVSAIEAQGIAYFADIEREGHRAERPLFSGEWKPTPLPSSFFKDGSAFSLRCGRSGSWLWPRGIEQALRSSGSFYKHSGTQALFVIPPLGLVVGSP